ncbi:MAG: hypothetical protein JST40_05350 [Armatimonadetes bacterium]|nr:hypothetical protein [Armatimonadota bacterium]
MHLEAAWGKKRGQRVTDELGGTHGRSLRIFIAALGAGADTVGYNNFVLYRAVGSIFHI